MISLAELREFVAHGVAAALEKNRIVLSYSLVGKSLKLAEAWPGVGEVEEQEYKEVDVAALFVDMRGSSERAIKIGDERTFATMHAYLPAMHLLVTERDGFVVRYTGDGLMALFGLEDGDLAKAMSNSVVAALRMRDAVDDAVNPVLGTYDIPEIACGWGIDAGHAVVTKLAMPGLGGAETAWETTAYGPAINSAAHLADAAAPGTILIGPAANNAWPAAPTGGIPCRQIEHTSWAVDPDGTQRRLS